MTTEGYKFFRVSIRGLSPLLMHNGQLADPLNQFAKAMKAVSGKRKKTDADLAQLADIEWKGGLYVNADGMPAIPSRCIEALIAKGAARSKEGKQALSGVFVESDGLLDFERSGKSIDEMCADPFFRLTVGVRVGQSRVMRTRPIFHGWTATFDVSASSEIVSDAQTLQRWLADGGAFVGLGDYRPRYGRFTVDRFQELRNELKAAA
jgi:hypothetical protein